MPDARMISGGLPNPVPGRLVSAPCIPRWSLPSGFGSVDQESPFLPPDFGNQTVTYKAFDGGIGLFDVRIKLNETVRFSTVMACQSGLVTLRLPRSGRIQVKLKGAADVIEKPDTYGFFLHGDIDAPINLYHQPNEPCDSAVVIIPRERLNVILDGVRLPAPVKRFLDGRAENMAFAPRVSTAIKDITLRAMSVLYTGHLYDLYINGILIELLAATLSDIGDGHEKLVGLLPREYAKIRDVIEMLSASPTLPPCLEAASAAVSMPIRRFAAVFHSITGQTYLDFVLEKKMGLACRLLLEGDVSVKEVAYLVGYAHVQSFTSAFTRRFGVPPASYRHSCLKVYPARRVFS